MQLADLLQARCPVVSIQSRIEVCIELTSVCIESTLGVYRNDFTCVSKRLRFVSKRLVSKRLCIETTVNHRHITGKKRLRNEKGFSCNLLAVPFD